MITLFQLIFNNDRVAAIILGNQVDAEVANSLLPFCILQRKLQGFGQDIDIIDEPCREIERLCFQTPYELSNHNITPRFSVFLSFKKPATNTAPSIVTQNAEITRFERRSSPLLPALPLPFTTVLESLIESFIELMS